MRSWKIYVLALLGVVALAGFATGQEGPTRESGPAVARPRKSDTKTAEPELPKIPSRVRNPGEAGDLPTFKSSVEEVTLDVAVMDNKGQFIPKIPPTYFRVLEDNVPQKITRVDMGEAPMTVALVIEWSSLFQQYWGPAWYQTLQLAWGFAQSLKPEDNCAVVAFDMKPEILTDFTTDRSKIQEALSRLQVAAWRESNLYDAITDTADRMSGIEGRKAIVLIASGIDTFSKLTFDKTRKSLRESGVPIYAIGLMQTLRALMDARGMMGPIQQLDFLQADNQLRTFANETGGASFFPRFEGEFPSIFQNIHQALRNQYVITYSPSNQAHDGTFRNLKVELIDPETNKPLIVTDEKKKPIKFKIVAKSGYRAPRPVE